ncbi:MAG: Gfo/Idh/MocA family oxidoreductase, partial [Verrucomicrobiota bacterium]
MGDLKIGVVGVGAIGRNHARVLSEIENAELVGVFDADAEAASAIAEAHGTEACPSLEALAEKVDAVTVATPTQTHLEVGRFFLERGKQVLVEKPLAASLDEARLLVEAAQKNGCVLQVGHIERFNPVLRELEKDLSNPRFIEAHRLSPFPNRSMDIGVVLDVMIHDLEIILHLVPSTIESVDAVGVSVLTNREDIANARLRFANGCVANITASRVSPEKLRKIRIFQENRYLSLDYQAQEGKIFRKNGLQIEQAEVVVE